MDYTLTLVSALLDMAQVLLLMIIAIKILKEA